MSSPNAPVGSWESAHKNPERLTSHPERHLARPERHKPCRERPKAYSAPVSTARKDVGSRWSHRAPPRQDSVVRMERHEEAFSGELVPTEAELARAEGRPYEPAAALLQRLASTPDAAPPKRPRAPRKKG